ncbi:tripartite tricarboxylate transporter substrate binding protein [Defluviimonas sp. WL0002]|uniref:Tripartite tricarboxylate transporter substrate binding protein n=1 Tax=Albidovulum marisflavi TaxID=2984159 RepID=A0ABT2ZDW6_9RHOB|nr:tripartite tricarboxylate transporter substrate binding protein [Defluviimonas sp. WL0002]MCV2869271.1 tripartite tricarboxylate transporter substrate binding protein [Defluviimonas sp. WL0002]
MKKLVAITAAAAALAIPGAALAEYPEKAVEFIVPWPPGDLEDVLTRMIADEFQATYGVPAAVVNKPGGGGGPFPGAAEVASAPADGYTVGSFVVGVPVSGPNTGIPALNPNPFDPLGIFLTYPFVIVSSKSAPYQTMEELAAHAKDNDVALGHFGSVLVPTKVTLALAKTMGFDYASEAAFDALDCNTLASGDADVINTTLQLILPCIDDVNVLASIGSSRLPLTADTPTVAELAPELSVSLWNGLFVNKDTPADAREKITAVAEKVMKSEAAAKLAAETGALIYWQGAADSEAQIEADSATLAKINDMLAQ